MSAISTWLANLDSKDKWRLAASAAALLFALFLVITPQAASNNRPAQPAALEVLETQDPVQPMLVHVSGEVARPGLYELPVGARVADAIRLSGGFTDTALPESVNLARVLSDGEQIVVSSQTAADASSFESLISINTASADRLDELPGIGPALAERIVQWRLDFGGFQRLEDLLEVSGIGEKLLTQLLPLITL